MFSGFCHLHIGQEALVLEPAALDETDYVISGYRSHTQAIAKGISAEAVFAELLGKATGCSGGKVALCICLVWIKGFGWTCIVGGQAPLASGVGFAIKYRAKRSHCLLFR